MIVQSVPKGVGMSVFTIDPGETNGWAWACIGFKEIKEHGVHESVRRALRDRSGIQLADRRVMCGQISVVYAGSDSSDDVESSSIGVSEWQAAEQLISTLEMCGEMGARVSGDKVPKITAVVIEDFILRERTMSRDLLSPVRITAALYVLLCQHRWKMEVLLQSPSDKSVINDDRLRSLGLWAVGQRHARDAYRHLMLYLRKHGA